MHGLPDLIEWNEINFASSWISDTDIFSCLDFTSLTGEESLEALEKMTSASTYQGVNVASWCLYPHIAQKYSSFVTSFIKEKKMKLALVFGNFPKGQDLNTTLQEIQAQQKIMSFDEVDLVFDRSPFLEKTPNRSDYLNFFEGLKKIVDVLHSNNQKLKVIFETGHFASHKNILSYLVQLALWAKVDFLKTSTGFHYPGADLDSVELFCALSSQLKIFSGIKPSGGISSLALAKQYVSCFLSYYPKEYFNPNFFRIGTSKLVWEIQTKKNTLFTHSAY